MPEEKAKAKHKPTPKGQRVIYTKDNRPSTPKVGEGTIWYCKGKIHRNAKAWRVFIDAGDRCDKKVKIGDDPNVSFQRCLTLIEAPDLD